MGRESRATANLANERATYSDHTLLMAVCQLLRRGFFGRLKWLILGR
jgi:hypothetical protein